MAPQLKEAVEIRRKRLIQRLIQLGIYKKAERHLYELTLSELESEYRSLKKGGQ
ncbi:Fur-regulated basic protein FbpA [Bacillus swezeyi]|uniref:Histidine kinase n=1 Tax=Bacillus swezeyi TaxID=1925020 RepID=A0A1R1QK42_9BACI|nr:Fur-regulated basic protein FbpA [Bacillus swezeyi]MEC1260592.1 Fur-regulated basic protein FbpA [Bacillus swezeyi]MED1738902.1 Fur-regulated basic protein FbpA [Bacillus swezeyi]MED2928457.1 Fur-regulated basic protein FbpA [Bacillus swezeyi]MED2942516.1 Fur-regulated basic protein FbpA [Bacillus swezeyi]MED2964084.1 Fur-regulated basic protein FbpA [Bacillus swezeyi]